MSTSIEELTSHAKSLIAQRNYRDAVRACRRVLVSRPSALEVRLLLGMALLSLERFDEARAEMLAALRREPGLAAAHRLLGEAYLRDGQPDKAAEALQRSVELDPTDDAARDLLRETVDEEKPSTETLDRWFDPDTTFTEPSMPLWSPADESVGSEDRGASVPPPTPPPSTPPVDRRPSVEPPAVPLASAAAMSSRPAAYRGRTVERPRPRRAEHPKPNRSSPPAAREADRRPSINLSPAGPTERPSRSAPMSPRPVPAPYEDDEIVVTPAPAFNEPVAPPMVTPPPERWKSHPAPGSLGVSPPLEGVPWDAGFEMPSESAPASAPPYHSAAGVPFDSEWGLPDAPSSNADTDPVPAPAGTDGASSGQAVGSRATERTRRTRPRGRWYPFVAGVLFVTGFALVVALAYGVFVLLDRREAANIAEAVRVSESTGRAPAWRRALRLVEERNSVEASDRALRARLLATLALELRDDTEEVVDRILDAVGPARELPDTQVARIYLALAKGRTSDARELALMHRGASVAELAYARARASAASGDWEKARADASRAVALRPNAPRYVALLGLTTARSGNAALGASHLDGQSLPPAAEGDDPLDLGSPVLHVARARVLLDTGRDPERAADEARRVLGELANDATPVEQGWAHLVSARYFSGRRDRDQAVQHALEAFRLAPSGDEDYLLSVAEVLISSSDATTAQQVLDSLPETVTDESRRALAEAEIALARGEATALEQALQSAAPGAQTAYLRGRLAEARGSLAAARAAYREAMSDPSQTSRATASLAALHLNRGETVRAIALLTPAVRQQPNDPETVPLLVTALLRRPERRSLQRARAVVQTALQASPDVADLQLAEAEVATASGDFGAALDIVRTLVSAHPERTNFQRRLARIATEAGDYAIAGAALEAILERHPSDQDAAIRLAEVALRRGSVDDANAAIETVAIHSPDSNLVVELRARLAVLRGDGARAAEPLRILAEREPTVGMLVALGRLLYQAEEDEQAAEVYDRALALDRRNPWALLGSSELRIRAGNLRGLRRSLQTARQSGARRRSGRHFQVHLELAEARLALAANNRESASSKAEALVQQEPKWGSAHWILAEVASSEGEDPIPQLRLAVDAPSPPPHAVGRLALALGEDEGCAFGRKYLRRAPGGRLVDDVRALMARCR